MTTKLDPRYAAAKKRLLVDDYRDLVTSFTTSYGEREAEKILSALMLNDPGHTKQTSSANRDGRKCSRRAR